MWWALQAAHKTGNTISYCSEVPIRMIYGDMHQKNEVEQKLSRIGLMCLQLTGNLSVKAVAIFLLQIATEFGYTLIDLIRRLIQLFTDSHLCPTQLFQDMRETVMKLLVQLGAVDAQGEVVEEVEVIMAEQSFLEFDETQITAAAGIMGGLAVILAAGFAGMTDYSPNKGFLKSIAEFGSKASKMKNGLYAILTCVKDFSTFVKECVLNYYGSKPADSVVKAVDSLNFSFNGEPVKCDELFAALNELNTQEGEERMSVDEALYTKGVAVCGVFSRVLSGQIASAFNIPTGTVTLLSQTLRTFEQRVKSAGVKQSMGNIRFTPFVVWIAGPPGCGKSVTLSTIVRAVMRTLQTIDAEKFEIPQETQWCHSANFTQEYHTGYNGQYAFQIDDMCQDKPGTLKNSSAMQFINWVSSVPANVTQAALEDKKCPFRSKILICTSNELYPNRSHEIVSNEAFLRRRNVLVHATPAADGERDPHLNWPIKFALRDAKEQTKAAKPFDSFFDLVDYIVDEFVKHFELQTQLVRAIRGSDAEKYLEHRSRFRPVDQPPPVSAEQSFDVTPVSDWTEPGLDLYIPEDPVIRYLYDNPFLISEVTDLMDPAGTVTKIRGLIRPESRVVQNWLMDQSQLRYDYMMTVMASMMLPEYAFRDCRLVHTDDSEIIISPIDKRRVELMRPWTHRNLTVACSSHFVCQCYTEPACIRAEQSAFWTQLTEKIPTWNDFMVDIRSSISSIEKWWAKFEGQVWWKILFGLSTIVAGYLAIRTIQNGCNSWRDVIEAEASYDHSVGRPKPIAKSRGAQSYNHEVGRSKPRTTTVTAVKSSFVQSVFHKNLVEVKWASGSMNGIFVKDTTFLTCHHFFCNAVEGSKFTIIKYPRYSKPIEVTVRFDPKRMVRVPGTEDAVLYCVGKAIDSFRDISSKFCNGDLPEYMDAAITSVYPEQEIVVGPVSTFVNNQSVEYVKGIPGGTDTYENARLVCGFNFQGHYRRGKSGSPLIADEKVNRVPTIFGIQTCISTRNETSYFEAVTKAQIDEALGKITAEQSFEEADDRWEQEDEEAILDAPESLREICGKSLEFVGPVKQPVHQATATKLRRSLIAPFFTPIDGTKLFEPAVLRDAEVDVMNKSMAGFSREYGDTDPVVMKETRDQFILEDRIVRKYLEKRLLTRDEVLNGLPGQGLKGLDLNTSPGIPLTFEKEAGKSGKKTWITMGDDNQRTASEGLWKQFDDAESDLRRGKMISLTAYACLKDELRTEEKVAAKKTRSFIVLSLIFNMLIRKYFGFWIAKQHQLAGRISSSVGIDANSEWTDLKRRLCAMGTDIEDFDYTDWDRSLHPEWFGVYAERVSAWYGDKPGSPAFIVRELLMRQLVFMNIQVGNWLLRTHGGNKSGCAITAEINTDIHDMLTYYVWNKICRKTGRQDISSLSHFRERVALALYGDDMLKATRKDVTPWFNGDAMKVEIEELGMHITPGDKDETRGFRIKTIDDVTFLKRRFLTFEGDCGRVRAPLDKSVIQRMVLWVHKSDSPVDALIMNVQGALREAFFWGQDFFEDFTERCQDAWDRSKCARVPFPMVYYQSVSDAWNAGHGDMMPALFQFRVVSEPVSSDEEV